MFKLQKHRESILILPHQMQQQSHIAGFSHRPRTSTENAPRNTNYKNTLNTRIQFSWTIPLDHGDHCLTMSSPPEDTEMHSVKLHHSFTLQHRPNLHTMMPNHHSTSHRYKLCTSCLEPCQESFSICSKIPIMDH